MNQAEGVRQVVERARAGDQVAMALIDETRRQAERGNKKAQESRKMIARYIKKHPASRMAGEASDTTNPLAQNALWQARAQSPEKFAAIVARSAPHVSGWALVCAMLHGPTLAPGQPLYAIASTPRSKIAACVRRAFRLQRIANNRAIPISSYCPYTACELGE